MKKISFSTMVIILLAMLLFLSAGASMAEPYFKGKTVKIIVPHSPGGGTDVFARVIARHLPRYIPGKPTIIVRNMLGGMGIAGSNYVYNVAKKDGLTWLVGSGYTASHSLLGTKGTKFNYDDMPVMMVGATGEVIYTRCKLCPEPQDIVEVGDQLVFGYVPMPASVTIPFMLAKELLGFETKKDVLAFDASGDARRAFLAGESDILGESVVGYAKAVAPLEEEGKVCPVWQSGIYNPQGELVRQTGSVKDIPTIKELYEAIHGKEPSGEYWEAMSAYIAYNRSITKAVFMPPGTEEYAAIVRDAIDKMAAEDSAYQKDAQKIFPGSPIYTGMDAVNVMEGAKSKAPKEVREWLRDWMNKGWGVEFQK